MLAGELDELRSQIDVLEKTRKMSDAELREISDRVTELSQANAALLAAKKKTELELQTLHVSTGRQTGARITTATTTTTTTFV